MSLSMWSHFFQKIKVKCPDGSIRFVYRSVDAAFPIHLREFQSDMSAKVSAESIADVTIDKTYSSDVKAILLHIDETNQSLMLEFRAAYIVYESNPCENSRRFEDSVNEIRRNANAVSALKIKVKAIIGFLEQGLADSAYVEGILREISINHPTIPLPSVASSEMAAARSLAAEMREA